MNHATICLRKQKSCGISNDFCKTIWLNLVLLFWISQGSEMNHATLFVGKQRSCGISNDFSKAIWLNLVLLFWIYPL